MTYVLAGAFGFFAALIAHDLAAQALADRPLRPLAGTCPSCAVTRGWAHLRCSGCGRRIGRELIAVVVSVVFAIAFTNTVGPSWAVIAYLGFLTLTLTLGITDIDSLRIVDRLNLRGSALVMALLGVTALLDGSGPDFLRALLGAAAYFVGTNVLYLIAGGRGFGYGDVKLSVQLGAFTAYISWGTLGWGVFITALIGGLLSILVLAGGATTRIRASRSRNGAADASIREAMRVELPYGPSMILGAWVSIALAGLGAFPIPT